MTTTSDDQLYRWQADQLALWLGRGKTLKQASVIVAKTQRTKRTPRRRKAAHAHSVMGTLILQTTKDMKGRK